MNAITFRIGHPTYRGANAAAGAALSAGDAFIELLDRGVSPEHAQRALTSAARGSHAVASTASGNVIEVVLS